MPASVAIKTAQENYSLSICLYRINIYLLHSMADAIRHAGAGFPTHRRAYALAFDV